MFLEFLEVLNLSLKKKCWGSGYGHKIKEQKNEKNNIS